MHRPRAACCLVFAAVWLAAAIGRAAPHSSGWRVIPHTFSGPGWTQDWHLVPAIHVIEVKKTPGEKIPGSFTEDPATARTVYGPERYRHRSLHWSDHARVPAPAVNRDSPARQASYSLGAIEKDWDFVVAYRDRILAENRLTLQSPDEQKVRAIARDIWMNHRDREHVPDPKNNSPSSYPADCLKTSSFCVGAGNALVMVCRTMGIPARSIHTFDHTMSEVLVDGRWWFVENTPRNCREGNFMVDASFMEVWTNPTNPRFGFSKHQQSYYWEMMDYFNMFGQADGLQMHTGGYRRMYLTPQTAGALYPATRDIWYKSAAPDRYVLVWGKPVGRRFNALKLAQGHMMGRRFWLGSLADTKAMVVEFNTSGVPGAPEASDANVPADGGEWFVEVNGRRHPLRDNGGFRLEPNSGDNRPRRFLAFAIPMDELKENTWNSVAIGNAGRGDEFFWLGAVIDAASPAEACLADVAGNG